MIDNFIKSKLVEVKDIVAYHTDLLGVKAEIKSNSHLNMKEEIFYLVSLFSSMDETFEDEITRTLLNDILKLLKYFDSMNYDEDSTCDTAMLTSLFEEYQSDDGDLGFEEFKDQYYDYLKDLRSQIVPVLNTKVYYLDMLIWLKAKKSKLIIRILRNIGASDSNNTKDFLHKKTAHFKSMISFKYIAPSEDEPIEYKQSELNFIKSLEEQIKPKDQVYEDTFNRLIGVKNKINIFKGMQDGDIRLVVKDVAFMKFNPHEVIITEGEVTEDIYFLLTGTCRVTANHKAVGAINEHQVFGEFSAITREQRTATVKTNTIATVLRFKINTDLFNDIPESFSILYKNVIDELIIKINLSNKKKF